MKRIAAPVVLLTCWVQVLGCATAPSEPKAAPVTPRTAYVLKIERKFLDAGAKITTVIVRSADRERVESRTEFFGERARERLGAGGQPPVSTTLYDFAAQKVYWSGFPGQDALPGGCAWGHYRSARAPVEEDFVTGTPDALRKMAAGRKRRADGVGVVHGIASHIEAFVGGTQATAPDQAAVWPLRVFLADDGGTLLRAEAQGSDGKPTTLFEVTQLTWGAPAGTSLEPPTGCTFGNSEMDDSGTIRAHAEASARLEASASMDAASSSSSSAVAVTSSAGLQQRIGSVSLSLTPQPNQDKCGQRLLATGSIVVAGGEALTISYRFSPSVERLVFPRGQSDSRSLDASGDGRTLSFATEVTFERSADGEMPLEAQAIGSDGQRGPLMLSEPVPRCAKT